MVPANFLPWKVLRHLAIWSSWNKKTTFNWQNDNIEVWQAGTEMTQAQSWGWFLIHLSNHQILFFPLNPRAVQSLLPCSRMPKNFMGKDNWGLTNISISSFLSPLLLSKKVFFGTAEKEPGQFFSSFFFWCFYSNLHFISTSTIDSFLANVFNSRGTILPPKWVRTHSVIFSPHWLLFWGWVSPVSFLTFGPDLRWVYF